MSSKADNTASPVFEATVIEQRSGQLLITIPRRFAGRWGLKGGDDVNVEIHKILLLDRD